MLVMSVILLSGLSDFLVQIGITSVILLGVGGAAFVILLILAFVGWVNRGSH